MRCFPLPVPRFRRPPSFAALVVCAALVVAATACASDQPVDAGSTGTGDDGVADGSSGSSGDVEGDGQGVGALDGRWLVDVLVVGDEPFTLVAGTEPDVRFDVAKGTIGVGTGCNSMGGDVTIGEDGSLATSGLFMTEMGCDPERTAQEEGFATVVGGLQRWSVDGTRLVLSGAAGRLEAVRREVADPDRPLLGTTWVLDTLGDGAVASSVGTKPAAWIEFNAAGAANADGPAAGPVEVQGHDGCNGFGADATVEGATITFGQVRSTSMACPDPDNVQLHFGAVLSGTASWSIEADRLTITSADGTFLGLHAENAAGS